MKMATRNRGKACASRLGEGQLLPGFVSIYTKQNALWGAKNPNLTAAGGAGGGSQAPGALPLGCGDLPLLRGGAWAREATPPTTILVPPLGGWQEDDGTSDLGTWRGWQRGHAQGWRPQEPVLCPLLWCLVPARL